MKSWKLAIFRDIISPLPPPLQKQNIIKKVDYYV